MLSERIQSLSPGNLRLRVQDADITCAGSSKRASGAAAPMSYLCQPPFRPTRPVLLAYGHGNTVQLHRPRRRALSAILTTCALAVVAAVRATAGACTAPRPMASPVVSAPIRDLP